MFKTFNNPLKHTMNGKLVYKVGLPNRARYYVRPTEHRKTVAAAHAPPRSPEKLLRINAYVFYFIVGEIEYIS